MFPDALSIMFKSEEIAVIEEVKDVWYLRRVQYEVVFPNHLRLARARYLVERCYSPW